MTATQAPTPGPLSGEIDDLAKKLFQARWPGKSWDGCDVSRSYWRRKARESIGLAPTAPVEASGSEREVYKAICQHCQCATVVPDETIALIQSRPQPSGETWEKIEDAIYKHVFTDHRGELHGTKDAADAILALLSARPLALGGQQGEEVRQPAMSILQSAVRTFDAEDRTNLDAVLDDLIDALSTTTPDRAEAQDEGAADKLANKIKYQVECSSENLIKFGTDKDMVRICLGHFNDLADEVSRLAAHPSPTPSQDEGAAGEPVAWRWRYLADPNPVWIIRTDDRSYWESRPDIEVQLLYAHPSPTPAADADRVRADRYYAALVQADLKIRSLPGTDQSDVEFIRSALKSEGK